jgi:hypothetical protein
MSTDGMNLYIDKSIDNDFKKAIFFSFYYYFPANNP